MEKKLADISKFLSFVLRHKPDAIGLSLDPEGWANVDELIAKADIPITHDLLEEVIVLNDKKRFSLSGDRRSIRANQGHSISVDLGLEPKQPPETLYHGTATRFLQSIRHQGLLPQSRQYVHLSADVKTATRVGERHGEPIILAIPALIMHRRGHNFFRADNGVWLSGAIPPEAISFQNQ